MSLNIRHHLDEATLLSYAAGSMSQAMALVTACHISLCPECQSRARQSESIGGLLLDGLDPIEVAEDALEGVLAAIDMEPDLEIKPLISGQSSADYSGDVPEPLRGYIGDDFSAIEWKRLAPGVWCYDLPCDSGRSGVSRLLRIAPGKAMLPHSHEGNELTLVLKGSFSDEMGCFARGDVADLDDQIEHQPLVDSDEECICLVATDAPLKFSTLLGKIVQPLTGF